MPRHEDYDWFLDTGGPTMDQMTYDAMSDGIEYILESLEADEISDENFVADARYLGYGDFELAQVLVDRFSVEEPIVTNANTILWRRQFHADAPFNARVTGWYENKTLAFDAALLAVAYRFGLSLPVGSGRCRS